MRFALVFLGMFSALALGPYVEMGAQPTATDTSVALSVQDDIAAFALPTSAPEPPAAMTLDPGLIVQTHSADAALEFIARPNDDTMPVMPDIPHPMSVADQEALPTVITTAPEALLTNIVPVRLVGHFQVPPQTQGELAEITGNGLALRKGPGKSHTILAALYSGDRVRITGSQSGKWVPIEVDANGRRGWVFHKFVSRIQ